MNGWEIAILLMLFSNVIISLVKNGEEVNTKYSFCKSLVVNGLLLLMFFKAGLFR
jgi:hypothetical protein